jgi:hypothetical protein
MSDKYVLVRTIPETGFYDNDMPCTGTHIYYYNRKTSGWSVHIFDGRENDYLFGDIEHMPTNARDKISGGREGKVEFKLFTPDLVFDTSRCCWN